MDSVSVHMQDHFSKFLATLNDEQKHAVTAPLGPSLVLAGAGSGKTRVLTGRAFYLLTVERVNPTAIIIMTFTNKAAGELRTRLIGYMGKQRSSPWAGTFHAFCVGILRQYGEAIGIARDFTIYDTSDTEQLLTALLNERKIGRDVLTPSVLRSWVSLLKNGGSLSGRHPMHSAVSSMLSEYNDRLRRANAVDFDDLLQLPLELFDKSPEACDIIQHRFDHVLIDEFQDTNRHQYKLARILAAPQNNLFVVGDDDQSIYGWRGAAYQNLFDFQHDYDNADIFKLERNYRSTRPILDVANDIIAASRKREEKRLWTQMEEGEKVVFRQTVHSMDEAHEVVGEIQQLVRQQGYNFRDFAVLYRTNSLSRAFEEVLVGQAVPYAVVGGTRFYERKEIKDLLAYLRFVVNPSDDQACRRVLGTPPRGIGDKTIQQLEQEARRLSCGMGSILIDEELQDSLSNSTQNRIKEIGKILREMRTLSDHPDLVKIVQSVLLKSGLLDHYDVQKREDSEERIANLEQVVEAARDRVAEHPEYDLTDFLGEIALVADVDEYDESPDRVTLMTIHAAKGLEFPVVFVVAVEEGLLPHQRSMESAAELDEERRLFYVAVTRAKERLYLSFAQNRYVNGMLTFQEPSQFLRDISPDHLRGWSLPGRIRIISDRADRMHDDYAGLFLGHSDGRRTEGDSKQFGQSYRIGDLVEHPEFGMGVVTAKAGGANDLKVRVAFEGMGSKLLAVKYAPLRKVQ